jgi:hypothetical protein
MSVHERIKAWLLRYEDGNEGEIMNHDAYEILADLESIISRRKRGDPCDRQERNPIPV